MKKYILCGNANTGKSYIFNKLSHSNAKVGNWLGVTCDVFEKKKNYNGEEVVFADLPGINCLQAESEDEINAIKYLNENQNAFFINVVDANNLYRNLYLTIELIERGLNILVFVNFKKTFFKNGGRLNLKKLSESLGVLCVYENKELSQFKKGKIPQLKTPEEKHAFISKILSECYYAGRKQPYGLSVADNFLLNKFLFLPIFVFIMTLIFYLTFLVSPFLFNPVIDFITRQISKISESVFFQTVIVDSFYTIFAFLPQITTMLFCLYILENSGYISRLAFMFDDIFGKIGLSGKSIFPMLLSFGCASIAVPLTKTVTEKNAQFKTAAMLSLLPCGAKMPIIIFVLTSFGGTLLMFKISLVYLISIIVAILFCLSLSRLGYKTGNSDLVLEFPSFKIVSLKRILINIWNNIKNFASRILLIVVIVNLIIFLNEKFTIFSFFPNILKFIFVPLGFAIPTIVLALIFGILAKEFIHTTLIAAAVLPFSNLISFSAAVSFLIFSLFYTPCVTTTAMLLKEFGKIKTIKILLVQFVFAYILAGVFYLIFGGKPNITLVLLSFVFTGVVFITSCISGFRRARKGFKRDKSSCKICNECKKCC